MLWKMQVVLKKRLDLVYNVSHLSIIVSAFAFYNFSLMLKLERIVSIVKAHFFRQAANLLIDQLRRHRSSTKI